MNRARGGPVVIVPVRIGHADEQVVIARRRLPKASPPPRVTVIVDNDAWVA